MQLIYSTSVGTGSGIPNGRFCARRAGTATVLAVIFVACLGTLALAYGMMATTSVRISRNERSVHRAQAAAESGLEYIKNVLSRQVGSPVPTSATLASIISNLKAYCTSNDFRDDLNVPVDVTVGTYMRIGGNTFKIQYSCSNTHGFLQVAATGLDDSVPDSQITRTVRANFVAKVNYPDYFDDGLYTNGTVRFSGDAKIKSDPANPYTYVDPVTGNVIDGASIRTGSDAVPAITLNGNDVKKTPTGGFWVRGWPQINPYSGDASYVHTNYSPPHMPTFDPTVFSDLAPVYYPATSNPTDPAGTYTNVRVRAGTNPSLSGTFRGILYIESPNAVSFGSTTLNCAIVVSDKDNQNNTLSPGTSSLTFSSNISSDQIPDDLLAIRDAVGGYGILAPTADLTMKANSNQSSQTIYGSIICNTLDWEGGASKYLINGAFIVLYEGANAVTLGGTADITLSKTADFVKPLYGLYDETYPSKGYRVVSSSYSEDQ